VEWDEEPTHHVDDFGEMDYMEGYNAGFNKGFSYGYEFGVEDFKLNKTFEPDIYAHFSKDKIAEILGLPDHEDEEQIDKEKEEPVDEKEGVRSEDEEVVKEEQEADLEEDDWSEEYLREQMGWWDYGFFQGFLNGFEMGYKKGWEMMKALDGEEKEEEKNQTRGTRYQEPPPPPPPEDEEEKPEEEGRGGEYDNKYNEYSEYVDDGYYEPVDFQFVRYKPIVIDRKDMKGDTQTVVLKVQDLKGIFSLVCKVSNDFTKQENGYVSPFAIKIDIHIDDYPFVENETKLALLTDVGITTEGHGKLTMETKDTSYDEEKNLADNEEEVLIEGSGFSGFFSWVKYATCDGVNKTVKVSTTSSYYGNKWNKDGYVSENFQGLTFNYPRAKKIVHDPKVGFIQVDGIDLYEDMGALGDAAERILNGNIWMYAVTAVIAIAFVLVTKKVRKKYY